jgi:plasmid stabilization system protein ParE
MYYANNLINKIQNATKILVQFPELGRIVPEYSDNSIRELIQW